MKKFPVLLFFLLTMASCRVMLVPAYDAGIVTQIEALAKLSDKLLLQIEDAAGKERAYANYGDRYIDILVELNDLLRKEKNRDKGAELVTITTGISEQFTKYRDRHREEDAAIKNAVLALEREYLNDHFVILLAAEKSLK